MTARIPGLDGLRGLAVMLVLAMHLHLPFSNGGWMGVDLFFVLSGYLITSLLMSEQERLGKVQLYPFYLRRVARLYPALIIMVLTAAILRVCEGKVGIGWSAVIALTYTQDIVWLIFGDALSGFNHVWSLAIEEHFYLIWPVIVMIMRKRTTLLRFALVGSASSFSLALLAPGEVTYWGVTSYFTPHTHAGPILAGCALALAPKPPQRYANWCAPLGFMTLTATIAFGAFVSKEIAYVPESVLATLAATLLIAACANAQLASFSLLCLPPIAWLGQISYGVYLYQFPLIEALSPIIPYSRSLETLILTTTILTFSALSHYAIERPAMRLARRRLAHASRASA